MKIQTPETQVMKDKTNAAGDFARRNNNGHRAPNPEQEEARVDEWNTLHPEGTRVRVKLDDGSEVTTTTLTEAWLLGGHTAVIKVCGIAGAYKLDRVTPL